MRHNKAVGVKISDDYKTEWPQMHDLWVISVQGEGLKLMPSNQSLKV